MAEEESTTVYKALPLDKGTAEGVVCALRVHGEIAGAGMRTSIAWGARPAALLRKISRDAEDAGREEGRRLPYASLRAALQVRVEDLIFLDSELGRPWLDNVPIHSLLLSGREDAGAIAAEVRAAAVGWADIVLRPWADGIGLSSKAIDGFVDAVEDENAFLASVAGSKSVAIAADTFRDVRDDLIACMLHRLDGTVPFPGLGPVRRVVRNRFDRNRIDFETWPCVDDGMAWSMAIEMRIETVPGDNGVFIFPRGIRRRWCQKFPDPGSLVGMSRLTARMMLKERAGVSIETNISLRRGLPQDGFHPGFVLQGLNCATLLPGDIAGMVEMTRGVAHDVFVGIPFSERYHGGHKIGTGCTARDHLDIQEWTAETLRDIPAEPVAFNPVGLKSHRSTLPSKKIGPEHLFAHYHLATRTSRDEAPDVRALGELLAADFPEYDFKTDGEEKIAEYNETLLRVRQANTTKIARAYENRRPVLVPVAATREERRQMAIAVEMLFGGGIEIAEGYALPQNAHGPRAGIDPNRSLKPGERFERRYEAWRPVAESIAEALPDGAHVLVQAAEWYEGDSRKAKDDETSKPAGRAALASIGGANCQWLLPPGTRRHRDFDNYFYRLQAAVYDLVLGHSGAIEPVGEVLDQAFEDAETRPQVIIGFSVLTLARRRKGGSRARVCIAMRLNPADGRTWARAAWWSGDRVEGDDWQPLNEFLKDIAGKGILGIGEEREAERRTYQTFVRGVVEEAAEQGLRPLVIVDANSARDLWKFLTNESWPKEVVFENLANADIDADLWRNVRFVRADRRAAGIVARRKSMLYVPAGENSAAVARMHIRPDTVVPTLARVSDWPGGACYWNCWGYPKTQHPKRGLSVWRDVVLAGKTEDGTVPLETWRKAFANNSPMPSVLEIAVLRIAQGDDVDRIARAVSDLRNGYGHHDDVTALPAPLAFISKVEDYAARFALPEEDDQPDGPDGDGAPVSDAEEEPASDLPAENGDEDESGEEDLPAAERVADMVVSARSIREKLMGSTMLTRPLTTTLWTRGPHSDPLEALDLLGIHPNEIDGSKSPAGAGKEITPPDGVSRKKHPIRIGSKRTRAGFSLEPVIDLPEFVTTDWLREQRFEGFGELVDSVTNRRDDLERMTGFANWPDSSPDEDEAYRLMVSAMRHPLFLRAFFRLGRMHPKTGRPRATRYTAFKHLISRIYQFGTGGKRHDRFIIQREMSPTTVLARCTGANGGGYHEQYVWASVFVMPDIDYGALRHEAEATKLPGDMTRRIVEACDHLRFGPFDWVSDVIQASDDASWLPDNQAPANWDCKSGYWAMAAIGSNAGDNGKMKTHPREDLIEMAKIADTGECGGKKMDAAGEAISDEDALMAAWECEKKALLDLVYSARTPGDLPLDQIDACIERIRSVADHWRKLVPEMVDIRDLTDRAKKAIGDYRAKVQGENPDLVVEDGLDGPAEVASAQSRALLEAAIQDLESALATVAAANGEIAELVENRGRPNWRTLMNDAVGRVGESQRACHPPLLAMLNSFRAAAKTDPAGGTPFRQPAPEPDKETPAPSMDPASALRASVGPSGAGVKTDAAEEIDDDPYEDAAADEVATEHGENEAIVPMVLDGAEKASKEVSTEDDVAQSDQAEKVNERLREMFAEREFGAAHHLCRAAVALMPSSRFVFDPAELQLMATAGFVPGMAYSEIEKINAAITQASVVANELIKEVPTESEIGHARRIALFASVIELALFGGGANFTGAMELIDALTKNGVGNCFYDLYRAAEFNRSKGFQLTVSNLYGAASDKLREHERRLVENIKTQLTTFETRRIGFSAGETVRNWMCDNEPIGGLINAFIKGKGSADKKARAFSAPDGFREWRNADLFITEAEKKSHSKQVIYSSGRDRFIRDITELANLCAGWVETLDALNTDNARDEIVKQMATRISGASVKALVELETIHKDGGVLVAAAVDFAKGVIERLRGIATGTTPPLDDLARQALALNGPLLWLPGLAFTEGWEPTPYEPDRIVDGMLAGLLPSRSDRRKPEIFSAAVEGKIREGSFTGARMLTGIGPHYGMDKDLCAGLSRAIEAEIPTRRAAVAKDKEHLRRRVVRAQRFVTESATDLVDLAAQLDEINVGSLGNDDALRPDEDGGEKLADFIAVERRIATINDQLDTILAKPRENILRKIAAARAGGHLGEDGLRDIERRLDDGDFATAEEMVEHAAGGHVARRGIITPQAFDAFYPAVPRVLAAAEIDLGDVRSAIEAGRDYLGLPFSTIEDREEAIDILDRWMEFKKKANGMGRKPAEIINTASSMLEAMGVRNSPRGVDSERSSMSRKTYVGDLTMSLRRDDEDRGILLPDFGSMVRQGVWRLSVFSKRPKREEMRAACDTAQHMGALMIVPQVLGDQARDEDARHMIEGGYKGLIIDEALFLHALAQKRFRALTMFEIAQGFSYAEPFGDRGDEPVPEEMFVGRREEIETVKALDKGFFVFGGRRLGKTALLQFVTNSENRPEEGRISAYVSLQQITKATNVWEESSKKLEAVFASSVASSGDAFGRRVKAWLDGDPKRKILLFLDEANDYVREDEVRDYQEFRQFQKLMSDTDRRFKVVFAGLQNLARMARNSENKPVSHFDSAILAIGPFMGEDVRYAEMLITRPLAGLGYRFKNDDDIWRILSFCNYYPILIQLFGENMVRALREKVRETGRIDRVIDDLMVTEILEDAQTLKAIHDAIDKTLKLDGQKYELLAYIIAENMIGSYEKRTSDEGMTAREVRAAAASYWPAAFGREDVTIDMVDALLEEMEVLGLLRKTSRTRRTLRSRSTLTFLGAREEIIETLLSFEDKAAPKTFDPRLRRRDLARNLKKNEPAKRSPLTTGQEFDLLKRDGDPIRVVLGIEAAGIESVREALEKAPMAQQGMGINIVRCEARTEKDLEEQIRRIGRASGDRRHVIVIPHSFPWNREWVAAARRQKSIRDGRVQVIFLGGPRNAYEWVRRDGAPDEMTVVNLMPWRRTTTEAMLRSCHVVEAEKMADRIHSITGGWNIFMNLALPEGMEGREMTEKHFAGLKSEIDGKTDLASCLGIGETAGIHPNCIRALRETAALAGEDGVFTQEDIAAAIDLMIEDNAHKPSARVVLDYALALGLVDTEDMLEERRGTPREKIKRKINDLILRALAGESQKEAQRTAQ